MDPGGASWGVGVWLGLGRRRPVRGVDGRHGRRGVPSSLVAVLGRVRDELRAPSQICVACNWRVCKMCGKAKLHDIYTPYCQNGTEGGEAGHWFYQDTCTGITPTRATAHLRGRHNRV